MLPVDVQRQCRVPSGSSRTAIWAASVAAVLALAACGATNRPHRGAGSAAAPIRLAAAAHFASAPACLTSHLSLSVARAAAAAGTAYTWYDLENTGPTICSMFGYPGVAVLNVHGRIVQHPATRGAALPARVRLVTLKPGQRAQFLLNSTDTIPSPGCPRAYRGVRLQVYPPNQRRARLAPYTRPFCNLRVGPVELVR